MSAHHTAGHPDARGLLILLIGQICMAISVIFIKASTLSAARLGADRLLLATVLLFPFWWMERRKTKVETAPLPVPALSQRFGRFVLATLLPGIFLGLHFLAWNLGARQTSAVHASMIVNMVPVVMPFFIYFLTRERPGRWAIIGTITAVGGLLVLGAGKILAGSGDLSGDLACLVAMLLATAYLALARRNAGGGLWSYVVPIYAVGGITCLLFSLADGSPFDQHFQTGDIIAVLGLTLASTMVGHSSNNWAMRRYHPQVVSLFSITQFIWAGVLAWIFYHEIPDTSFYLSALVVLGGCVLVLHPWDRRLNPG